MISAVLTPELKWQPNPDLTRKQNNFVHYLVNHPKESFTEAAVQSYDTKSRINAKNIAFELSKKPAIIAELAKYSTTAETNLIKLANATTDFAMEGGKDGAAYAGVAERVNNSILDRLHGKSTQKVEQTSLAISLNIDLSSAA